MSEAVIVATARSPVDRANNGSLRDVRPDDLAAHPSSKTIDLAAEECIQVAARRLYDAEFALHVARQAKVDTWIAAAYDRLHEAVVNHRLAQAACAS